VAIKLIKGGDAESVKFAKMRIGLGWDPILTHEGETFDLDVSAFMLNSTKKLQSDDYLVFYNSELRVSSNNLFVIEPQDSIKYPPFYEGNKLIDSKEHHRRATRPVDPDFSVWGSIDDMDGTESEGGDDETMNIDLRKLNSNIVEIVIGVSIYDFAKYNQNFGKVSDSYVSIYNEITNEEVFRYDLQGDFATNTAIEFCSIYSDGGFWKIKALGFGHDKGLDSLLSVYN
jgi:tellurium resistance protein TerD